MNKDFKVKVEKEMGGTALKVTHNGCQWSGIRVDEPEYEIPIIISVLQDFLRRVQILPTRR